MFNLKRIWHQASTLSILSFGWSNLFTKSYKVAQYSIGYNRTDGRCETQNRNRPMFRLVTLAVCARDGITLVDLQVIPCIINYMLYVQ